jgi:hypothetical protein
MAKIPYWGSDGAPELWDTLKLGGATLPGRVEITGGSIGVREDRVPVPGGKEEVNTLSYRPAEVEIVVAMWEQIHLDKFKEIVNLYGPKRNNKRIPLTVLHPALNIFGINFLYVIEMTLPIKTRTGLYESTISLREFWEDPQPIEGANTTASEPQTKVEPVSNPEPQPEFNLFEELQKLVKPGLLEP